MVIKITGTKSERLKIKREWNWKTFVISWLIQSKKQNSNQKNKDQI